MLKYIETKGGQLHLRHKVKEICFSSIDNPNVTTFKMGNKEFKIDNSMIDEYDYSGEMLTGEIVKFLKSNISQSEIQV